MTRPVEFKKTLEENGEAKLQWFDEQLYTIPAALCKGLALQMVKNVRTKYGVRGGMHGTNLTREVVGKSGASLDILSDRDLHPKPIKNYSEALACIEKWVVDTVELKAFEQHD